MKIAVYDPPMCCPTGVCGPSIDPALVQFAADLEWLQAQGVTVERFNLSQQPAAFAGNPVVRQALATDGNDALPLTLADDRIACQGRYPSREELAAIAALAAPATIFTAAVRELVAIGAAIASNCEPCFKFHYAEARRFGVSKDDVRLAVDMARRVKETPADAILTLADKVLSGPKAASSALPALEPAPGSKCCG